MERPSSQAIRLRADSFHRFRWPSLQIFWIGCILFIFVKQLNRFVLFLSLCRPPIPSVRKDAGDKWRSSASAFAAKTSGQPIFRSVLFLKFDFHSFLIACSFDKHIMLDCLVPFYSYKQYYLYDIIQNFLSLLSLPAIFPFLSPFNPILFGCQWAQGFINLVRIF